MHPKHYVRINFKFAIMEKIRNLVILCDCCISFSLLSFEQGITRFNVHKTNSYLQGGANISIAKVDSFGCDGSFCIKFVHA